MAKYHFFNFTNFNTVLINPFIIKLGGLIYLLYMTFPGTSILFERNVYSKVSWKIVVSIYNIPQQE